MAETEKERIRGTRMYLGTIVDCAESIIKLVDKETLKLGIGQKVTVSEDGLFSVYYSLDGRYQIQVKRIV